MLLTVSQTAAGGRSKGSAATSGRCGSIWANRSSARERRESAQPRRLNMGRSIRVPIGCTRIARTPWMISSTPSMSTSTVARAKILPNFTGLTDRTVIETTLAGGCSASSGDDPAIDRSRKGKRASDGGRAPISRPAPRPGAREAPAHRRDRLAPVGKQATSRARRSVACEGTARRARGPPVRYRDKPAPTPERDPFCTPIDRPRRRNGLKWKKFSCHLRRD
jgi:hypothetical protein